MKGINKHFFNHQYADQSIMVHQQTARYVILFSCGTVFVLHSLRVALCSCCTFHVALFSFCTYSCCTIFVLHFVHVALFPFSTFFKLFFFRVAPFSCCINSCYTFFVLHYFHVHLFHVTRFS